MTTKSKRFIRASEFSVKDRVLSKAVGKSETVPDGALTPRELLDRFAHGTLAQTDVDRKGTFREGEPDLDSIDLEKFRQLDLFDREEVAREHMAKWDAIAKDIEVKRAARQKLENQRKADSKINARLDERVRERERLSEQADESASEKSSGKSVSRSKSNKFPERERLDDDD